MWALLHRLPRVKRRNGDKVMASVIEVQRKAIETTEIEARLDALEERQ